jgi:hypothetical protein
MAPYVVLVFFPYLLFLIVKRDNYEDNHLGRKLTLATFFLFFFFLLAFRSNSVGTDTPIYENLFNNVKYNEWSMNLKLGDEPLYFYLQKTVQLVGKDFHLFILVAAALSVIPWWILYSKTSDNAVLSIAIFVAVAPFSMFFSGIRQVLAMGFVVPVWYCVKNKKWLLYALCVLAAYLLHSSAWIIALILPLYYLKFTKKWLAFFVPVWALVLTLNKPLFEFLVRFIGRGEQVATETGAYTVLILLGIFTAYSFFLPREENMDQDTIAMRNILILTVFIQCFAPVHNLAMRMNYYFLPIIPVLISRIARRARYEMEQISNISVIVMVVFFTFWFLRGLAQGGSLNIVPYTTWLF